jgi:hypothetical protein
MKVFVSYSRFDYAAVSSLATDLSRATVDAWADRQLGGDDAWWSSVLDRIRATQVFILAMSDNSIASEVCRLQFRYAKALDLPIVPVQIGETARYSVDAVLSLSPIDFRNPTPATAFSLMGALLAGAAKQPELPDPLPEPPPSPYEFLKTVGDWISDSSELGAAAQREIVSQFRNALRDAEAPTVIAVIQGHLLELRKRPDITLAIANEIDALLLAVSATGLRVADHEHPPQGIMYIPPDPPAWVPPRPVAPAPPVFQAPRPSHPGPPTF